MAHSWYRLIALALLWPCQSMAAGPPTMLPQGEDAYFFENHLTGAALYFFGKDGRYLEIGREHLFIAEVDAGRWLQRPDGEVWLCSNYRFHPIVVGGKVIVVGRKEDAGQVPAMRDALAKLLKKRSGSTVPKSVVLSAASAFADDLDGLPDFVPRAQLEGLAEAVDTYLKGPVNLTRWRLLAHKGRIYAASDKGWGATVEELRADLDSGQPGYRTATALRRISAADFEESIGTTQPFLAYPQMNQGAKERAREIMDMKGERVDAPACGAFPAKGQAIDRQPAEPPPIQSRP